MNLYLHFIRSSNLVLIFYKSNINMYLIIFCILLFWGNGSYTWKHCVALWFSLGSFSDGHKDRYSEPSTNILCMWDNQNKTSEPMEIDSIDLHKILPLRKKVCQIPPKILPLWWNQFKRFWKKMYLLCLNQTIHYITCLRSSKWWLFFWLWNRYFYTKQCFTNYVTKKLHVKTFKN